jgi:rare lipoprotein A
MKGAISLPLNPNSRALGAAGALSLTGLAIAAQPSIGASSDSPVKITGHRLHVVAGQKAAVDGVLPGGVGRDAQLERRTGSGWHLEDRDRTDATGRFALAFHPAAPGSSAVRVRLPASDGAGSATAGVGPIVRAVGRLNVYRRSVASVYGPGLYGTALACGGHLSSGTLGVASKTVPCGAQVTFRHGGRTARVPVVDRGPYVGGRDWDLTMATAKRLGFGYGVRTVLSTR